MMGVLGVGGRPAKRATACYRRIPVHSVRRWSVRSWRGLVRVILLGCWVSFVVFVLLHINDFYAFTSNSMTRFNETLEYSRLQQRLRIVTVDDVELRRRVQSSYEIVGVEINSSSRPLKTTSSSGKPVFILPKGFEPQMTSVEQSSVLNALARLVSVCDQLGMVYMLYGGSLLGSFRFHDMVPWDDDVDFLVAWADRHRLQSALDNLVPDYVVFEQSTRLKFWKSEGSSRRTTFIPWQWPYVDISFYEENATHIWDAAPEFSNFYVYRKSIVFPTHLRPYAGLWLPAPRDTLAFIVAMYSRKRHCSTSFYSHKFELNMPSVSTRCEKIKQVYPFVYRRPAAVVAVPVGDTQHLALSPGIIEVLMLGDVVIHSVHVEEPTYTVDVDPYVLPTRRRLAALLSHSNKS